MEKRDFQIELSIKIYPAGTDLPEILLNYGGKRMVEVTSSEDLAGGKRILIPAEDSAV